MAVESTDDVAARVASSRAAAAQRRRIVELIAALGTDELEVVRLVVEGLVRGRETYRELRIDDDHRDFRREATDEIRDSLVYLGAELVRLHRRRP